MKNSVTITLLSYNDEQILTECLESIRRQDYPGTVEILLIDGGSTDNTRSIAKQYNATVLYRPDLVDAPHERLQIGLSSIETDIVIFFSADNRFQEDSCLREMILPFQNKNIPIVQTFRYGFFKQSSLLTKYFALIGGADPIAIELGKADRAPYDADEWHSFGQVKSFPHHFEVTFKNDSSQIPTLGANGIAIRNSLLKKFPIQAGLHTEMCLNFIKNGYPTFVFVKDVHIVHEISLDIISFCKRRLRWATLYSGSNVARGYNVFSFPKDVIKLVIIVISAFTFVFPSIRAIKGYISYRHVAWFMHPIILFVFVVAYGIQVSMNFLRKVRLI